MAHRTRHQFLLTAGCVALFLLSGGHPAVAKAPIGTVPKWQRWELALQSSVVYTNPLQQAEMRVLFVSPLGETNRVYGFWDGGKTWKVRFKPNFPGRWRYVTMRSDTANQGLNGHTGEFLCTTTKGESRFDRHGPVRVARDQQHLEHADHLPFFWLGDAAWLAAVKSTPADWREYLKKRAEQKFNTVQWQMLPASEAVTAALFTGHDCIAVNPAAFQKLDAKIVAANAAGLLNAIAPLWEIGAAAAPLPEDQAIRLLRYVVARWGADDVAWIVAFECDSTGGQARRWQNIGRAVFNHVSHGPVVLLPGESLWACDAFRQERWVDILGVQTTAVRDENSLPWLLNGPLAQERRKSPARPLIAIAPASEGSEASAPNTIDGKFARRLLWWNALLNTPAGVSYSAKDAAEWMAPWREALTLPGVGAMAALNEGIASRSFWELQPLARLLTSQPGRESARQSVAAVATESQDLSLIYIPESQAIGLAPAAMTARTRATWLNPRTGAISPAVNVTHGIEALQLTLPGPGDWLLILERQPAATPAEKAKKTAAKIDKAQRD